MKYANLEYGFKIDRHVECLDMCAYPNVRAEKRGASTVFLLPTEGFYVEAGDVRVIGVHIKTPSIILRKQLYALCAHLGEDVAIGWMLSIE